MRDLGAAGWLKASIVASALAGALVAPGGALGATAAVSGGTLTFTAAGGEANDVFIETDGGNFRVIDNTAPVTAGALCTQRSLRRVNCPTAGVTLVKVVAADGDDKVVTLIGTTDANLQGGRGNDDLTSADGDDVLSVGSSGGQGGFGESLTAGDGDDTLHGPTSANSSSQMNGGPGDDQLLGGPSGDSLFGDTGADLLRGGGGFDFVGWAGPAVTVTLGAGGADDGAPGEGDEAEGDLEFVQGTDLDDTLIGGPNAEQLFGGSGKDTLRGGGGDDNLSGADGADKLEGEDGNDTLAGGQRADDVSGGDGTDLMSYSDHVSAVTVTINNNANDGQSGEGDNVRTDVEDLEGGSNDDTLTGSGQDNEITGAAGDDDINGGSGDDDVFGDNEFNFGFPGEDTLNGEAGDDRLFGGGDADVLNGGADYDFADYSLHGGFNALTITINNVADDGAAGEADNVTDTVEGVVGANGTDTITGSSAANTLFGGGGIDELHGANGADLIGGESPGGNSAFGADVIDGGSGVDTATYVSHTFNSVTVDIDGVADDGAAAGAEGDNVQTTVENLIGSEGFDSLTGNAQPNTLAGRGGNDLLVGGAGGDLLTGNSGQDTHEGQGGKDEINSRGDNIVDFDNCGTEADVAIADAFDTVNPDCESVIP